MAATNQTRVIGWRVGDLSSPCHWLHCRLLPARLRDLLRSDWSYRSHGELGHFTDDSSYTEPVLDHFISGSDHVTYHCTYRVVYVQMKKLARRQNEDGQQSGGVKDKKTAPPGGAAAAAAAAGGGAGKNHNKRTSRDDDILRMPVHYTLSFHSTPNSRPSANGCSCFSTEVSL